MFAEIFTVVKIKTYLQPCHKIGLSVACFTQQLRELVTLSEKATMSNLFCLSSEKRTTLKEKNLLPDYTGPHFRGQTHKGA